MADLMGLGSGGKRDQDKLMANFVMLLAETSVGVGFQQNDH